MLQRRADTVTSSKMPEESAAPAPSTSPAPVLPARPIISSQVVVLRAPLLLHLVQLLLLGQAWATGARTHQQVGALTADVSSRDVNNMRSQVLRILASSEADVKVVRELQHRLGLDPWRELTRADSYGDFLVPPSMSNALRTFLSLNGISYSVLINDTDRFLTELVERETKHRAKRSASEDEFRYKYLSYDEIINFLNHVRDVATNATVRMGTLGLSFERRQTPFVKITSRRNPSRKKIIFMDGGFHSREWISPAMALEVVHRLALNREQDPDIDFLLDNFDWIIVPLVNPDGYAYTFEPVADARLWRKSRTTRYSADPWCYGVDLNRNFGYMWNDSPGFGGSKDPCDNSYSGPHNFSEPESQNMRDLLLRYRGDITSYLSFHSFGEYMLYPWGYADVPIEDEEDLLHVANAFGETMTKRNYNYLIGGSARALYPAAGGSNDYVRARIGAKYAYTVELSPSGQSLYGFILPEYMVQKVVTDTWEGLKAFMFRLISHSKSRGRSTELERIAEEMNQKVPTAAAMATRLPVTKPAYIEEPVLGVLSQEVPTEAAEVLGEDVYGSVLYPTGENLEDEDFMEADLFGSTPFALDPGYGDILADPMVDTYPLYDTEEEEPFLGTGQGQEDLSFGGTVLGTSPIYSNKRKDKSISTSAIYPTVGDDDISRSTTIVHSNDHKDKGVDPDPIYFDSRMDKSIETDHIYSSNREDKITSTASTYLHKHKNKDFDTVPSYQNSGDDKSMATAISYPSKRKDKSSDTVTVNSPSHGDKDIDTAPVFSNTRDDKSMIRSDKAKTNVRNQSKIVKNAEIAVDLARNKPGDTQKKENLEIDTVAANDQKKKIVYEIPSEDSEHNMHSSSSRPWSISDSLRWHFQKLYFR